MAGTIELIGRLGELGVDLVVRIVAVSPLPCLALLHCVEIVFRF